MPYRNCLQIQKDRWTNFSWVASKLKKFVFIIRKDVQCFPSNSSIEHWPRPQFVFEIENMGEGYKIVGMLPNLTWPKVINKQTLNYNLLSNLFFKIRGGFCLQLGSLRECTICRKQHGKVKLFILKFQAHYPQTFSNYFFIFPAKPNKIYVDIQRLMST